MLQANNDPQYDRYKKYYPDKWAAISALRRETGMNFSDANNVINELFGMTDDDERIKDDAEQEKIYQAQFAGGKDTEKSGSKLGGFFAGLGLFGALRSLFGITTDSDDEND